MLFSGRHREWADKKKTSSCSLASFLTTTAIFSTIVCYHGSKGGGFCESGQEVGCYETNSECVEYQIASEWNKASIEYRFWEFLWTELILYTREISCKRWNNSHLYSVLLVLNLHLFEKCIHPNKLFRCFKLFPIAWRSILTYIMSYIWIISTDINTFPYQ